MADKTTADDDFYDDEQTLGRTEADVDGQALDPPAEPTDQSQSIYNPEKHTTLDDDRGDIEVPDNNDSISIDRTRSGDFGPEGDPDSARLADVEPSQESQGEDV